MKYIKFIALILLVCMLSSTLTSCAIGRFFDELINGDSMNITLPKFPATVQDYSYTDEINATISITNITYEVVSNDYIILYFTGEKTYDVEGENYDRSSSITWKLYDSEGYVVEDGTVFTPNIAVGDKFKDEEDYIFKSIDPEETYELVISSYNSSDISGDTLGDD